MGQEYLRVLLNNPFPEEYNEINSIAEGWLMILNLYEIV
jgi:hypothetical protein